jgi:hypothetical protein
MRRGAYMVMLAACSAFAGGCFTSWLLHPGALWATQSMGKIRVEEITIAGDEGGIVVITGDGAMFSSSDMTSQLILSSVGVGCQNDKGNKHFYLGQNGTPGKEGILGLYSAVFDTTIMLGESGLKYKNKAGRTVVIAGADKYGSGLVGVSDVYGNSRIFKPTPGK